MDSMTSEDLNARLRANAKGLYPYEAATELLIRTDVWLRRQSFRDACIETWGPTDEHPHHEVGARINWDAAGEARVAWEAAREVPEWLGVCSGGERRLIQIAHDIAVGAMSEVSGLDRANVALVLAAVSHASGAHEHEGGFTTGPDGALQRSAATPENSGALFDWPTS